MATKFTIRTKATKGYTALIVRCQAPTKGIDYRITSALEVDIQSWNKAKKTATGLAKFREANPALADKMDLIKKNVDVALKKEVTPTKDEVKAIIDGIVYAEARAAQKKREEEKAKKEAEENKMTLNKYIATYNEQIKSGARQTESGRNFAPSTVKTVRLALDQFTQFQKAIGRTYDFDDIDMVFYYDYTAWLKKKKYSVNTVGKCVKELKTVMACAESEGHHTNHMWRDKKFKGTRIEVDSIYLTREDLDKIMAVDLSKYPVGYEQARDIFMIGI